MVHAPAYHSANRGTAITGRPKPKAPANVRPVPPDATLLHEPNILLNGTIDGQALQDFLRQMRDVRGMPMTEGGDADAARRMALEIRLFSAHGGRRAFCVGKTTVYSAGMTILAAFPREHRFLTADATLLVHERHVQKTINLNGPIKSTMQLVREQLSELETAERVEREDFDIWSKEAR